MSWRYQAVWRDDPAGRTYSICEVYFTEDDRLKSWTESCEMWPGGDSIEDLGRDLVRMYVDAARWKAVAFDSLKVGMTFERLISREKAEGIAQMFDQFCAAASLDTAPAPGDTSERSNTEMSLRQNECSFRDGHG